MKRTITILALAVTLMTACIANADALARDALITYSGTDAFTKLESGERQACVEWLVRRGTMSEECSKAVMKLVALAPEAVTAEQRQALISEASGEVKAASAGTATVPVPAEEKPQITKKNDDSGKIVAIGLLGLLAGLVIHNNVKHHKSSPSYAPAPPRPAPAPDRRPPQHVRAPQPPQPRPQPQPRNVNRPMDKRPPHR